MAEFGPYKSHPSLEVDSDQLSRSFIELVERLRNNYPFFHPRYAGQMLKPPHPVAMIGYVATMLINPNNHASDGGPATAQMEKEVVAQLAQMFGYGQEFLGHLTSSGTIANLEALFVAREIHPTKASRTALTRTTPTAGCVTCSGFPAMRCRPTPPGGWT